MNFTLQLFFTLLAGFLLGPKNSFISVCIYLLIGLVGVPVFASGGGFSYIFRPSFGFLLGFALAAYTTGTVARMFKASGIKQLFVAAVCGMAVQYLCGMVYFYLIGNFLLHMNISWEIILINCCLLTIGGDTVLCFLSAVLAYRLRPVLARLS